MRVNENDIGKYNSVYLAYSSNPRLRKNAASGAVVTQLLIDLINSHKVDKVIVSRLTKKEDKIVAEVIATDSIEDIKSAQTSIYFDFNLLGPVIEQIQTNLKYAIVMLPCQAKAFNVYCQKRNIDRNRFVIIGLFCGHATDRKLLDLYFKNKQIDENKIISFKFRTGHWRGKTRIKLDDKSDINYPAMHYNILQNLFFFTKQRCLSCTDHFGEYADISCGDAWLSRLKSSLIKHSLMIARNEAADLMIKESLGKTLIGSETDYKDLLKSQKRSVIFHRYNIAGRLRLSKLFGIPISYKGPEKAIWNDVIGAFFILANYKLSYTKTGQTLMFKIPRPILFAYAIFIKVFLNF